MKIITAIMAAAILLVPYSAGAQTASAQAPAPGGANAPSNPTVKQMLDMSDQARADFIFNKLVTLMKNLGADRYRGKPKPPEMREAHLKMYNILYEHFFPATNPASEGDPNAFNALLRDFLRADPGADVDAVFTAHIRDVVQWYERGQKAITKPAGN